MRTVTTGEFDGGSVFIDGDWKPLSEAKISLFDWGFTRSDATYDVVSVWHGAFFRLDDHLDRFFASLAKMRMTIPYSRAEVRADPARLRQGRRPARRLRRDGLHARRAAARLARSAPGDQPLLRLCAAVRLDRAAREAEGGDRPARQQARCASRPSRSTRRSRTTTGSTSCSRSSTPTTAAPTPAASSTPNGNVAEGPGFNVFMVKDGVVRTPERGVLEGISRRTVIELCGALAIPLRVDAGAGGRPRRRRRGVPELDRRRRAADRQDRRPAARAALSRAGDAAPAGRLLGAARRAAPPRSGRVLKPPRRPASTAPCSRSLLLAAALARQRSLQLRVAARRAASRATG